jgi:archaemetzincin
VRVTLKPFGAVDPGVLERLTTGLRRFGDVSTSPIGELPSDAFDLKRDRYRAAGFLEAAKDEPGDLVLAVTSVDLFDPGLTFVFGLATTRGRHAVISTARLAGDGPEMLAERSLKEAAHEIGHLLGLDHHREDPGCVMFFSRTLEDTDRKGASYCKTCDAAAEFTLKRLRR